MPVINPLREAAIPAGTKLYPHPLLTIDEERNQLPHVFATATFATVRDRFFLVTPEHALREKSGKPVWLSIDPAPLNMAGKRVVKTRAADIAAIELSIPEVDAVAQVANFITRGLLASSSSEVRCEVQGYPWKRNRMEVRQRAIDRRILPLQSIDVSPRYFPDDLYNEHVNFALEYDEKNLRDSNGAKLDPRQLAGMSGGIVQSLCVNGGIIAWLPKGIFLAQDNAKKALVGLRYSFILDWLECNLSDFSC